MAERDAVVDYFQHDTLFAHQEEEKLSEEDLKEAWNEYEKDKLVSFDIELYVHGVNGWTWFLKFRHIPVKVRMTT